MCCIADRRKLTPRVPLTVADKDAVAGTITIIFQVVGKSAAMLASLCLRARPGAA